MTDKDSGIKWLHQHIVPVLLFFDKHNDVKHFVITTFVLSVSNRWFLVTAGHCIRYIEQLEASGYNLVSSRLIDSLGLDASHPDPIPFDYKNSNPVCLSDDNAYDYGVISLSDYYVNLLKANKIRAFDEEAWEKQPQRVDYYSILGIPQELVKFDPAHGKLNISYQFYRIDPASERPEGFSEVDAPLFYGHINLGDGIKSRLFVVSCGI